MRRTGLGIQPGRPGSSKRLLCRRTETLSAARFRCEPPIPLGRRLPSSSARSRRLASPCKRRSRNCSKRKSSSRLSGRGGASRLNGFRFGENHFFVRVVRGPGEHGGKFLRRLGGARSAEVLAVQQNG